MGAQSSIAYSIVRFIFGMVFLLAGGEYLVRGSVGIAKSLKLSPLLIGAVVVGFGTSVPELLTSLLSVVGGKTYAPGIAIGNVIGSNIANILLIIGLSAAIRPLSKISVSKLDLISLVVSPAIFALAILMLGINKETFVILSVILIFAMSTYIVLSWKNGKSQEEEEYSLSGLWKDPFFNFAVALIAILIMYFGTRAMISEATVIARAWGVSDTVIGLSIIAVGTSLPELAASIIAAIHRESEISVGNIIGSNIFNILFIPGITGIAATYVAIRHSKQFPITFGPNIWLQFTFMMIVTVIFAILLRKGKINRLCGSLLFAAYIIYMTVLFYWK